MKFLKTLLVFAIATIAFNNANAQKRGLEYAVTTVMKDYFEIKNALAANNAGIAQNKAAKLIWDLNNVPTKDMNSQQHAAWFDYLSQIQRAARAMSESSVVSAQRRFFIGLSSTLYGAVKNMKINPIPLYWQYSAAADAYWLNENSTIKNPYFGIADKKMGKEGVTKEILPAITKK